MHAASSSDNSVEKGKKIDRIPQPDSDMKYFEKNYGKDARLEDDWIPSRNESIKLMMPNENQLNSSEKSSRAPKQARNLDGSFSNFEDMLVQSAEVEPINLSDEKNPEIHRRSSKADKS